MIIATASRRRCRAFSLIELLVVLAIVSLMASLTAPSLREQVQSWRLRTLALQLVSAIWLARATALRSGQKIVLCPLTDNRCGGLYQEGFGVFSGEGTLLHHYPSRSGVSVTNRIGSRPESQAVVWNEAGLGSRNATFLFCAKNTQTNWAVVLNRVGRPRLRQDWGICPS